MSETIIDRRPVRWSQAESEPLPANIHALLDDAAAKHADHPFWVSIEGDEAALAYAQFSRLTRVCARRLHERGVRKGTHVGLMLPNTAAFVIAWFALSRLGAVAIMINTASTSAELARMLQATDASFLVVDREFLAAYDDMPPHARPAPARVIVHGAEEVPAGFAPWAALLQGDDSGEPLPPVGLDDIASMQFTSGSSGTPKACMLSHRYWLLLGKSRACIGPAPERMLVDSPLFYMGPSWRVLMAMYCGATVFVARKYSLSRLFDRMVEHRIDFCSVTYPVAKLEDDPRLSHSSLKWLTTYGLAKELHRGFEQKFGVPVREIYGMTEVGSALSMPVEDTSMVGSGSCGLPAPFRRCKVMVDCREAAPGEAGELWVTGPGLFSGYYRNAEATAASFVDGWFRTGDLFTRDANGYFFMLGRIKDVIRRSGENISAAEIELAVNAIDGVLEAAAIPVPDALRGEEVKVIVARAPGAAGAQLTAEAVTDACRRVLSPYKVPRYVEFAEAIPKTASGKIDKNALKARAAANQEQSK